MDANILGLNTVMTWIKKVFQYVSQVVVTDGYCYLMAGA